MSRAKRAPRIVAELGRPETPEETRSRLAENSRLYRSRKTVNNLVLSLIATLATVLIIVLIVPRNETPLADAVNYAAVASQLQPSVPARLAVPDLPDGWRANSAEYRPGGSDQVASWYIGLLTPAKAFIGFDQAFNANPTWLAEQVRSTPASDTVTITSVQWDVYRNDAPEADRGNFDYALVTVSGPSTYVLVGTATPEEFAVLAQALGDNIRLNGAR